MIILATAGIFKINQKDSLVGIVILDSIHLFKFQTAANTQLFLRDESNTVRYVHHEHSRNEN